jgi:hypothetical protein
MGPRTAMVLVLTLTALGTWSAHPAATAQPGPTIAWGAYAAGAATRGSE